MDQTALLESVANNELLQFLGVKIEVAEPERVVLTMPVTSKVHQYTGIMNGGVSVYLAETAASIGVVAGSDLDKVTPVGIEINANHLRAVSKGIITVEAKPLHTGRTMSVWKIDITNDRGKLVCTSRITLLIQKRVAYQPTD
ncbi:MAG TPA: PaaI family thioesterase [Pyrinomonadaceae bacterium]|nr:PaaI family thioesterase [Pyrinomonadaceae bacterium]